MISTRARWGYRAVLIAVALGLVWGSTALTGGYHVNPGPGAIFTRVAATMIVAILAMGFTVFLWRGADEYRREGRKFAWFWGGTIGLLVSAPICVFVRMGGLGPLVASLPAGRAFALGYALAVMSQAVGCWVAWAWWLRAKS